MAVLNATLLYFQMEFNPKLVANSNGVSTVYDAFYHGLKIAKRIGDKEKASRLHLTDFVISDNFNLDIFLVNEYQCLLDSDVIPVIYL
ncbi:hypothetical protein GJ496_010498 [Pomphorhynchus laevis]|nr:hypothetical protein GJ496_010498 [Pomphorhynchus laevis]